MTEDQDFTYTIEPNVSEYVPDHMKFYLYKWGVYKDSSVLAGQDMKCFVDAAATVDELLKKQPSAEVLEHCRSAGNTYNHLSAGPDGEAWADEY